MFLLFCLAFLLMWTIHLLQKNNFHSYVALGIPPLMTDNSSILYSFTISNVKEYFILYISTAINFNFYDSFKLKISAPPPQKKKKKENRMCKQVIFKLDLQNFRWFLCTVIYLKFLCSEVLILHYHWITVLRGLRCENWGLIPSLFLLFQWLGILLVCDTSCHAILKVTTWSIYQHIFAICLLFTKNLFRFKS
jgi:hypothetical protein